MLVISDNCFRAPITVTAAWWPAQVHNEATLENPVRRALTAAHAAST
jgi:hypothetical protein